MIGHPLKVRELLEEIKRGDILLPEFQRAYVWKSTQVVRLIDSLYHEYPSGQILLWDTNLVPVTKLLSGVNPTELATVGRPKIVLDGQQRLTSLYKALSSESREPVDVLFSLETEEFRPLRKRLASDPRWVPVREVVSHGRHDLDFLEAISGAGGPSLGDPETRVYLQRLQKLRRIGDYAFPIEIFRSDDFDEVTELFIRANSGGTRLRQAELVLAQLALHMPGSIVEQFEKFTAELDQIGFRLGPRFLVRALVAIGTGQSRFKTLGQLWQRSSDELDEIWRRTDRGLKRAVEFVRHNARFHASEWVPSINSLIPLVTFFDRHPNVVRDVEVGLLRWFYIVSLRGRYSGSPESAMDADIKAAQSDQPVVELLKIALDTSSSLEIDPEEFDTADWRNPLYPLTYASARKRGAVDLFTGISLGDRGEAEVVSHPIFPKAKLKKIGIPRKQQDEIANLVFLTSKPDAKTSRRSPEKYLPDIAEERLRAQCIPLDRDLWKLDRYVDFLGTRRTLLADAVSDLLDNPL